MTQGTFSAAIFDREVFDCGSQNGNSGRDGKNLALPKSNFRRTAKGKR